MMKEKQASKQVNINLDREPALYAQLRILASRKDRKMAALGRIALRQYVARHSLEIDQPEESK